MAQGSSTRSTSSAPRGSGWWACATAARPLRDDQPLRIAVNNYRAAGSAGYTMFRDAKVVWRSGREIRDLMVEYFGEERRLPAEPDGNWRIVPPRAAETLAREEAQAR
jgi:2',3'-cyclic-nucleotide 2'-phosphodiesterase / 3'-nucleotidase